VRWVLAAAVVATVFPAPGSAASLDSTTLKAWHEYVDCVNAQLQERLNSGKPYLWMDENPARLARVRAGEIVVSQAAPSIPKKVPSGLIHDWIGATFVPHASLNEVLEVVRDYSHFKDIYRPMVIDSRPISKDGDHDRFSMLLMNQSLLQRTVLDTEYDSSFVRLDDRRVYSILRTTRIQQIENYGTPGQHVLPADEGTGLIWRIFSVTRYLERDGGVYVELEVVVLSRDIPASLRWLIDPIVRRVSRGSLSTSLRETAAALRNSDDLVSSTENSHR
jgi:hypothetical protein